MSSEASSIRLDRPIFVIGAPRSGTTNVFERLVRLDGVYSIGVDGRNAIERMPVMDPAAHDWKSNALDADDATPEVVAALSAAYLDSAADRQMRAATSSGAESVRIIEKSSRNALRVPFLAAAFPDAQFVLVHRDPAATLSDMVDGWLSERSITYRDLPGWKGSQWSMPLVEGWRHLLTLSTSEMVVQQWASINAAMLDALEALPDERWCVVDRNELIAAPSRSLAALCDHLGLERDRPTIGSAAGTSIDAATSPKRAHLVDDYAHIVSPIARRLDQALADHGAGPSDSDDAAVAGDQTQRGQRRHVGAAASAVHEVLQQAGVSLIASTYRNGRVVIVRPGVGDVLGIRSHRFDRPMGIAVGRGRIAIASHDRMTQYELHAGLADRLSDTPVDACYVPASTKFTGDANAQEAAFALGDLWFVSTRFSCLATIDRRHSFVPRWRPSFVSALAPDDRCHLTGMAMKNGGPSHVTAAAMTDDAQGWRREKVGGGVLVDVDTRALVAHGLTLPHSPRWHDGRLWLLDSGNANLCTVDVVNGLAEPVVRLPGFARGLAFVGPYAFVGLSKLRPQALAGLPLSQFDVEPVSGIWMIDTRTGEIAGHVRFNDDHDEVFDLQVLPGMRWPDLLEIDDPLVSTAYVLPDVALERIQLGDDNGL